jgi:hypothetical protein
MKTLVYFTVGGDPEYINMLQFCVKTLHEQCDMTNVFVMVMCDINYFQYVEKVDGIDDIMITKNNKDYIETSMKKTRIFEYLRIWEFEKVLYLDCDIIILKDIIADLMPKIKENKLYILQESTNILRHKNIIWSFEDYTYEQIDMFKNENIFVFNCGQFAFLVTKEMNEHFEQVCELIDTRNKYFYEQSHMNYHFNLAKATDPLLNKYVRLIFANIDGLNDKDCYAIHFAYGNVSFIFKLNLMMKAYENRQTIKIDDYFIAQSNINNSIIFKLFNRFKLHKMVPSKYK